MMKRLCKNRLIVGNILTLPNYVRKYLGGNETVIIEIIPRNKKLILKKTNILPIGYENVRYFEEEYQYFTILKKEDNLMTINKKIREYIKQELYEEWGFFYDTEKNYIIYKQVI